MYVNSQQNPHVCLDSNPSQSLDGQGLLKFPPPQELLKRDQQIPHPQMQAQEHLRTRLIQDAECLLGELGLVLLGE